MGIPHHVSGWNNDAAHTGYPVTTQRDYLCQQLYPELFILSTQERWIELKVAWERVKRSRNYDPQGAYGFLVRTRDTQMAQEIFLAWLPRHLTRSATVNRYWFFLHSLLWLDILSESGQSYLDLPEDSLLGLERDQKGYYLPEVQTWIIRQLEEVALAIDTRNGNLTFQNQIDWILANPEYLPEGKWAELQGSTLN